MKKNNQKIVIIGGGVIGTSIAYHLAKSGATHVTLVEAGDLASGSSGACDGLVFMQSKKPGIHLQLAMASVERFAALQEELPVNIEFSRTGGLVVIETEAEYRAMEKFVAKQQAIGLDVRLLDQEQLMEKEPCLSRELLGASYSSLDAQVNPINLTLGFGLAANKLQVTILNHTKVLDILTTGNRVTGVATTGGKLDADIVVNAGGSMAGKIAEMVDMQIPVQPRRGQIVVTSGGADQKRILNHCLLSAKYIAAKYDPEIAAQAGQGVSMEQTDNGNLLLGSTREFVGFDKETTFDGIQGIITQTTSILPALKHMHVIRTFAGLRPYSPDGLPVLGRSGCLEGLVTAAGHEGDGIALAPITGELMAKMILGQKQEIDLTPFSPDRFAGKEEQNNG